MNERVMLALATTMIFLGTFLFLGALEAFVSMRIDPTSWSSIDRFAIVAVTVWITYGFYKSRIKGEE